MQVNEVVVNGVTELSLVNDTVSEDNLLEGATAHDASGKQITGKVVTVPVDSELNAESENAIQNKAVAEALTKKLDKNPTTFQTQNGKVLLTENSEGGNLRLTSPDGTLYMEQDCYNNNIYRCYAVKDGATKSIWYYDSVNNVYRVYPVAAFVNARMAMQMQGVTKGSTPTATQYARLQFVDNSGSVTDAATVAMVYASVDTSGNTHLSIGAANNVASTWTPYGISVNYVKAIGGYAQVSPPYSQSLSCLRNIAAGTAAATTTNCPNGALYGQYT